MGASAAAQGQSTSGAEDRSSAAPAPRTPASNQDLGQADAAAQFDAAVTAYKAGEFARAAEQFLVADGLAPSVTALSNALAAARRARVPLLMARAAQRALARSGLSEADRRSARGMLDQAEPQLARIDLQCSAAPCSPLLDGLAVMTGVHYAEPGAHRAGFADGAEVSLQCGAGQQCPLMLSVPVAPAAAAPAASDVAAASLEPAAPAVVPAAPPPSAASDSSPRWKRRLPLGVLIASGATALLFGGLAVWQGVAALDARQDYEDGKTDDWDDVRAKARRSDAFMVTGIALAGVAAATAIWWVDWDAQSQSQLALLPEGGATLTTRRRF